jgi:hypothetical protein
MGYAYCVIHNPPELWPHVEVATGGLTFWLKSVQWA